MRMFCPKCGSFMEVKKNGVTVRPKNYLGAFHADLWECPTCGIEVLVLADREDITLIGKAVDYDFSEDIVEKKEKELEELGEWF